ncbi:SinR [Bradyrhizobium sp. USDA 10063]
MAHYIASYDLHRLRVRNYHPMLRKLESWGATRLLDSLWVFNSNLSASQIRVELGAAADAGDAFVVIELKSGSLWACEKAQPLGIQWLRQNVMA